MNTGAGTRRWSDSRLGRGAIFLGIVWSIAGASLLILQGLPSLLVEAVAVGLISADLTGDRRAGADGIQRCAEQDVAQADRQAVVNDAALQRARYSAFRMGRSFGLAAGTAFSGTSGRSEQVTPMLQQVMQEVHGQAASLGVPAPELPVVRHMSTALSEFADDLSGDRQCTAARLASRYSPVHGEIYRFGAVIGYAAIFCVNDVCGAHGTEIRRYGLAAGIPEHLWLPMSRGSLADVPGTSPREKTLGLLAILDEHVRVNR